mmetsp:Transcript_35895/g.70629  ORF Transcript_35895/g.70629 Transcript_35895/m.70629 type:complete len:212 (-) Transcript_35895:254-889(-)
MYEGSFLRCHCCLRHRLLNHCRAGTFHRAPLHRDHDSRCPQPFLPARPLPSDPLRPPLFSHVHRVRVRSAAGHRGSPGRGDRMGASHGRPPGRDPHHGVGVTRFLPVYSLRSDGVYRISDDVGRLPDQCRDPQWSGIFGSRANLEEHGKERRDRREYTDRARPDDGRQRVAFSSSGDSLWGGNVFCCNFRHVPDVAIVTVRTTHRGYRRWI